MSFSRERAAQEYYDARHQELKDRVAALERLTTGEVATARKLLEELLWAVDNDTSHEPSVSFLARKADEVREFLNPKTSDPRELNNLSFDL